MGSVVARAAPAPSDYPYGTPATNEFKWLGWDPDDDNDKSDGMVIHNAFLQWADLVKAGAAAATDTSGDTFKRWFGGYTPAVEIKQVFDEMWNGTSAAPAVAGMVNVRKDFLNECTSRLAAYTVAGSGRFHVCPYGIGRPVLEDIDCKNLDASCSAKMRSLSMTLLHEMT